MRTRIRGIQWVRFSRRSLARTRTLLEIFSFIFIIYYETIFFPFLPCFAFRSILFSLTFTFLFRNDLTCFYAFSFSFSLESYRTPHIKPSLLQFFLPPLLTFHFHLPPSTHPTFCITDPTNQPKKKTGDLIFAFPLFSSFFSTIFIPCFFTFSIIKITNSTDLKQIKSLNPLFLSLFSTHPHLFIV